MQFKTKAQHDDYIEQYTNLNQHQKRPNTMFEQSENNLHKSSVAPHF